VSVQVLQRNFETIDQHLRSGHVSQQDFLQTIRSFDRARTIDDAVLLQIARKFERKPGQFAYTEFISRLQYEDALIDAIDFIFLTFKNAMEFRHLNQISALFNNMMDIEISSFYSQI